MWGRHSSPRVDRRLRRMTSTTSTRDVGVDLECDDEFEEFVTNEWSNDRDVAKGDEKANEQWENEWDDDASAAADDFTRQLRSELSAREGGKA